MGLKRAVGFDRMWTHSVGRRTTTSDGATNGVRGLFVVAVEGWAVRLVHEGTGGRRRLASDVDVAESRLAQGRGLMFRRSIPDDYALVFPFGAVGRRSLHMLFVPFPIDAVWLVDDEVTKVKRLHAWWGIGWGRADCVVELPAGAANVVEPGDRVVLEDD